jgi:carbon monoxide dehydrogenase subunit G
MQLSNQQTLPVTQQQAWEALNDVSLLQASIPGCESITPAGENQYELAITASVGPVKARFKGKLTLQDLQPPTSYTMQFEGQGGAAGHGKGSAQVRLEPTGPSETVLHYSANASVGGKLAQIGSRLIDMTAQKMANDFFATFNAKLSERYGAAPAAAPATPVSAWARFIAWLKRVLAG